MQFQLTQIWEQFHSIAFDCVSTDFYTKLKETNKPKYKSSKLVISLFSAVESIKRYECQPIQSELSSWVKTLRGICIYVLLPKYRRGEWLLYLPPYSIIEFAKKVEIEN